MKKSKALLNILLFGIQIPASLLIYIYFAHAFSVLATIFIAIVETTLSMWVYSKISRKDVSDEPAFKEISRQKGILRTIPRRRKVGVQAD